MANINQPSENQIIWQGQSVEPNWYSFFASIRRWVIENSQSGTTAQRPTTNLYTGRQYFDTSLGANGKPIWVDKTGAAWVDASGASV